MDRTYLTFGWFMLLNGGFIGVSYVVYALLHGLSLSLSGVTQASLIFILIHVYGFLQEALRPSCASTFLRLAC